MIVSLKTVTKKYAKIANVVLDSCVVMMTFKWCLAEGKCAEIVPRRTIEDLNVTNASKR